MPSAVCPVMSDCHRPVSSGRHRARRLLHGLLTAGVLAASLACGRSEPPPATTTLVAEVRAANTAGDAVRARTLVEEARTTAGVTPVVLVAQSWVGRGALATGDLDTAEQVGRRTYDEAVALLASRPLDAEPDLPLALGASIELLANVAVARDARSEALAFLEGELARYGDTSMATRLQKNINLLSLEGTEPPPLSRDEHLGDVPPPALDALRGQVVLVFFWAHWCSDCKQQGPVLALLRDRYAAQGLTVLAPTRRYGYVAGGEDAPAAAEKAYIAEIWRTGYAPLADLPVHLDAANHRRYGVSTTPTLLLVDRAGRIRLYHPGQMTDAELDPLVRTLLAEPPPAS